MNSLTHPILAPPRRVGRGFTLVEAVLSMLIVGVLLASSVAALGAVGRARFVQAERRQAYGLAEELMSEVIQSYYADPGPAPGFGPEAGERKSTRLDFNDVDDYAGWAESPPRDKGGAALAEYRGWGRAVEVAFVTVADPAAAAPPATDTGLKRVTVTVTSPRGTKVKLVALRSKLGAYEQPAAGPIKYVTWAGLSVQVGAGKPVRAGAHPLNESTPQP